MKNNYALIADIGGTYARFASIVNRSKNLTNIQILKCSDFAKPEDAIEAYLKIHNINNLEYICIAVAGPVARDSVSFTNSSWNICTADLKKRYNVKHVKLLNDFESIAYSLLHLKDDQLLSIPESGYTIDKESFVIGVLGPGSGLGIAGLCCRNKKLFSLASEGGHSGFAPETEIQHHILHVLFNKFNRVTNEQLLSGPGLVNIYNAICELEAVDCVACDPAAIFTEAKNSNNSISKKAVTVFFEILGQVAGDLALTFSAYDGIYIAGGMCQRNPEMLVNSPFRESFENKGKQKFLLENTPTWLITYKYPGLLGASIYARNHLIG